MPRHNLEQRVVALEGQMGSLRELAPKVDRLASQISHLRLDMEGEFSAVRREIATEFAAVRGGMAAEFKAVRGEIW